jgi:Domain of unknown function (DUF4287)
VPNDSSKPPAKVTGQRASVLLPSIEKKYGRPIAEWEALIRASPLTHHMEFVTVLQTQHAMGHGHVDCGGTWALPTGG